MGKFKEGDLVVFTKEAWTKFKLDKDYSDGPLVIQKVDRGDYFVYIRDLSGHLQGWFHWRFEHYVPKDIPLSDYL